MPFFVCSQCNVAFPKYPSFVFHWDRKHKDIERPPREAIEAQELPEGVELQLPPQKSSRRAGPVESEEVLEKPSPQSKPQAEEFNIEELPREPVDLFYTLLKMKGISEQQAKKLQLEFKLSSWLWGDAQEITGLLRGAKLNVTSDWIRSFLKQYHNSVELPQDTAEYEFIGGKRPRDEFFGKFDPSSRGDPVEQLIRYQMLRDEKREEREREPQRKAEVPSEVMEELQDIRGKYENLIDLFEKDKEKEQAQRLEDRLAKQDEKMDKFMDRIVGVLESKQKKGDDDGGGGWMRRYLDERDKGHDKAVADLSDKLAEATKSVQEAHLREKDARARAIEESDSARERARKDLEESGYAPRKKDMEEKVLDIASEQLIPGVLGELREIRRTGEKIVSGGMMRQGTQAAEQPLPKPVTTEQAAKMAEVMEIEEKMKGGETVKEEEVRGRGSL